MNLSGPPAPRLSLSHVRRMPFLHWPYTPAIWTRIGRVLRALRASPVGLIGSMIVAVVLFLTVAGPLVAPHDPMESNLRPGFQPPGYADSTGNYLLGTDQLGRDILSRIIAGSRVSVIVGVVSVAVAGTIGVTLGLVAGFSGGWVDALLMRVTDGLLGIPFIVLVVAVSGIVGSGLSTLILILGFTGWVSYARVIRGEVLVVRQLEYVVAARTICRSRPVS